MTDFALVVLKIVRNVGGIGYAADFAIMIGTPDSGTNAYGPTEQSMRVGYWADEHPRFLADLSAGRTDIRVPLPSDFSRLTRRTKKMIGQKDLMITDIFLSAIFLSASGARNGLERTIGQSQLINAPVGYLG